MDSLELIRTFREVATRGSFSKASGALGLSKANTSKYVAALEERLGVRLLNRSTRSVSLTDAGELLLERSAPLMELVSLTRDELAERADQPMGRVHVSAPYGLGEELLAGMLSTFSRRYPKVHLSLNLTNRAVDLVEEAVDLVVRVGRVEDSDLIVRKLKPVPLRLVATPDYWDEVGRPRVPEDLSGGQHQCLIYSVLHTHSTHVDWNFQRDGKPFHVAVSGPLDATDGKALLHFAKAGLGVAYLPHFMVASALADGSLEAVLLDFMPADLWLYLAYAQRRHNSAAMRALLAFLQESISSL